MQDSANFPTPKGTIPRFEPGVYHDIEHEVYLASEGVSSSQIKTLVTKSPAHVVGSEDIRTAAKSEGTLFHEMMAIGPDAFQERYCIQYEKQPNDLATVADIQKALEELGLKRSGNKAEVTARLLEADPGARILDLVMKTEHGGKLPLARAVWDSIHNMRDGVMRHADSRVIIEHVNPDTDIPESSAYWIDPETGLLCKMRPDLPVSALGLIVDFKRTRDASRKKFGRQMAELDYPIQDAHYREGWQIASGIALDDKECFVFIAVEPDPPYEAATYTTPLWALELAAEARLEAMYRYRSCLQTGHWPGYQAITVEAEIPTYYKNKYRTKSKETQS